MSFPSSYTDEIAKIEPWVYTDQGKMIGFRAEEEGSRIDVDLYKIQSCLLGFGWPGFAADGTDNPSRQITFIYTKNSNFFSSINNSYTLSHDFPYLRTFIAPNITMLPDYAFHLASISLIKLDGLTSIISDSPFDNANIDSLILPNVSILGSRPFGATIRQLKMPRLVNDYGFNKISGLSYIELPEVESLSAFGGFPDLKTAVFKKCSSIDTRAFWSCPQLESIYFLSSSIVFFPDTYAFRDSPIITSSNTGYIYVPSSLLSLYQDTYSSYAFSDKFKPIEGDIL